MVVLNNPEDLKKDNLGYSWFTNPNRINNPDFKEQLDYLKGGNVYLITAKTMENNIDIPRTLFHRDGISLENEIVVKDDSSTKIKLISVNKPK